MASSQIMAQRLGGGRGGGRRSQSARLPAPTLGWNARDAYEAMKPGHAIILDNFIPGLMGIRLRDGHQSHASGLGAPVETVMEYAPPDATGRQFFGAAGASIFDISASGPVGAASKTGLTSALWQSTMIANSAGSFLYAVNGADTPIYFDGSAWVDSTFTAVGLDATKLCNVVAHKNRLWFAEKSTLNAWYGDLSAIGGSLHLFDIGGFCSLGGEIVAIGTWTRDGGSGADDLLVILTSEGEVLVYSGTNPGDPTAWALVGVFQIARPVGRRCFIKSGADLGVLTVDGPVPLTSVLPAARSAQKRSSITDAISSAFRQAYGIAKGDTRWGIVEFPTAGIVLVNVPDAEQTTSTQFVLSIDTGGWARWTNIDAATMGLFNDELYFGKSDGTVWKYGSVFLDGTTPITARLQTAFVSLQGIEEKRFLMVRPIMQGPPGFVPNFVVKTNYDTSPPAMSASVPILGSGTEWDAGDWDASPWEVGAVPFAQWQSVGGMGSVVSIAFQITTDIDVTLQAFDLLFDRGGI